ncbi:recombinase family protein [Amycolatopsis taiwanensis]|uniref:recombinase family protein n=1 Tax=Amycolatopsis taiwanensis TaxID=342230 RepID=UPI003D7F97EB
MKGRRRGRPRSCPDHVLARIVRLRRTGARYVDICASLNTEGIPTPGGGAHWYPSRLSRLLRTRDAQRLADEVAGTSTPARGR